MPPISHPVSYPPHKTKQPAAAMKLLYCCIHNHTRPMLNALQPKTIYFEVHTMTHHHAFFWDDILILGCAFESPKNKRHINQKYLCRGLASFAPIQLSRVSVLSDFSNSTSGRWSIHRARDAWLCVPSAERCRTTVQVHTYIRLCQPAFGVFSKRKNNGRSATTTVCMYHMHFMPTLSN